jgi:DNA-directed RNA polymerase subunit RPC12/RpoP
LAGQNVECPHCHLETLLFIPKIETILPGESKCDCQRCGQPIAFPVDLHNTEVECPHCHRATTLLIPSPSARVRKADSLPPGTEPLPDPTLAYVLAIILPLIGFFFGVWLMGKKQSGHGAAVMALSIFAALFWLLIFSQMD